ncbi:MAG TPA: hypothetical protein VIX59_04585 [Candidatus Binataceae bacterium]
MKGSTISEVPDWKIRPPLAKWILGYPDQARQLGRAALEFCRTSGLRTRMLSELFAGQLSQLMREAGEAAQRAAAAERLAIEYGSLQGAGVAMVTHGWAIAESGDPARGIAQIGRARETLDASGSRLHNHLDVVRAQCLLQLGQIEEGLEVVAAALVYMEASEERVFAAEINRLKGELLARDGALGEEAEAAFRAAIAIAQHQRAKSWELRATTSLARLLAKQGKRGDARAMLSEIYNWFTEGFDTADLKDAKALLDELNG